MAAIPKTRGTLGLVLSLFVLSSNERQSAGPVLRPEQLRQDLAVLRETFEAAHAGIYRYTPEATLDSAFDATEAQLGRPMSDLEFYRRIVRVVDLLHDGHTSLLPSMATERYLYLKAKVFPLDVRYISGRAFVEKNLSTNAAVPIGGEIISINGNPMAKVTERILAWKSADGFNLVPKYTAANTFFWHSYFMNVDTSSRFDVVIRASKGARLDHFKVDGVASPVIRNGQFTTSTHKAFDLSYLKSGQVALMSLPTLGDTALSRQFRDSFHEMKLRATPTLILDLRDNGGGSDQLNTELLSYLVPHPFRFYRGFTFRAKNWDSLRHTSYSPDDFSDDSALMRLPPDKQAEALRQVPLPIELDRVIKGNGAAGVHLPKPDLFLGDVYLLTNGLSQSSAGEVAALLHFLGGVTLIGEEPNAGYQGVTADVIPTLTLPNSGLRTRVPLVAYENAVLPELLAGRSAPPHFLIAESLQDAIQEHDTVMEFTLHLIQTRASNCRPPAAAAATGTVRLPTQRSSRKTKSC
jgi:hypothetical protein